MGIVLGFLSLLCFALLIMKGIARKFKWKKLDKFLMKIHKYVSAVFILLCFLHIVFVLPAFHTRNIYIYITGIVIIITSILLIVFCHTMKKNKIRKMKWHRILTVIMLIGVIIHILVYNIDFYNYQKNIQNIHMQSVDVSKLEEGVYIGEHDAGYIYAKVEVTIEDGEIVNINILEHKNERGNKAEKIVEQIISEQKINVDAVSGATNSSSVIKKAIESAVLQ